MPVDGRVQEHHGTSSKAGDTTSVRSGVRSTRAIRATRPSFSRVRRKAPQNGVGRPAKEATTT
jgi:hypothetical protein